MNEDEQARRVLETLTGLPFCPFCHQSCSVGWGVIDGLEVAACLAPSTICPVVYYRRDGYVLHINAPLHPDGSWHWSLP